MLTTFGGLLLTVSGCSVPISGVMGLSLDDERVVATVRMCEGVTTDYIWTRAPSSNPFRGDGPTWRFSPIESGTVDLGPVSVFSELMEDSESIDLLTSASDAAGAYLHLEPSDLEQLALSEGQILAWNSNGELALMDVLDLERQRDELCEGWF